MLYPIKSPKIASVIIDEELEEIARVLKVEAPKEKEPMAFLQVFIILLQSKILGPSRSIPKT